MYSICVITKQKAKKSVRQLYDNSGIRCCLEEQLRKVGGPLTYVVDMDNKDYDNIVSLHQKRDRQIIFLFTAVYYVLETIWNMFMVDEKAKKSTKVKSKINSGAADDKDEIKKDK